ncbi:MAG: 2-keto-4-pentenoate hydratase [Acidobacteria bacterium]|nr:2-keto-4-pentenoate hydratase [Acidobacteriota bacterium]
MSTDPKTLAQELTGAYAHKAIVAAPSSRDGGIDLDTAYAVEAEIARAKRAAGQQTVGWKVGYANKAVWRALKLDTLVWAHVYDDTVRYADWNDATLSIAAMMAPKIEPEIVFKLASVPASNDAAAVLAATEWYALGFEIIDCVFPEWKFQPVDFVAARGLHAALVIGEPVYVEPEDIAQLATDMAAFTVRLLKNNEMVEEGAAKNALKSPALCVGELGEALKRRGGETLQAGDIISTGTLTTSLPISAGDTWIASLSGIPPSSLTLRVT